MQRRSLLMLTSAALLATMIPSCFAQTAITTDADKIVQALTPRRTRGIGVPSVDPKALEVVDRLRTVRRTRGLSLREADELHDATTAMPQTDLEVYFAFGSAAIDAIAVPVLDSLGVALNSDALKTAAIVIGGHTDAKGAGVFNQSLSEQRAQAVASYLSTKHNIDPARMLAAGYGPRKLKVTTDPLAAENRRVQIVNAAR
jgi:OmpA-OmpF porin, OOP family